MTSFGQDGIFDIEFHYSNALRVQDHYIDIEISRHRDDFELHLRTKALSDSKDWAKENIDTTFSITKEQFQNVIASIQKISCAAIIKEVETFGIGHDGNICEIVYGSFNNAITYKVWTPNSDTNKRGLTDFYNCCVLIAKTAGLKSTILFK